jgi:hypothetical protein
VHGVRYCRYAANYRVWLIKLKTTHSSVRFAQLVVNRGCLIEVLLAGNGKRRHETRCLVT